VLDYLKRKWLFLLIVSTLVLLSLAVWSSLFRSQPCDLLTKAAGLNANVLAAIIGAVVSVFAVIFSQKRLKEREIAAAHRLKKNEAYSKFGDLVSSLVATTKDASEFETTVEHWSSFSNNLILWGSPSVIKSFHALRKYLADVAKKERRTQDDDPRSLLYLDDVFFEIRKALDLDNSGLKSGDLIKIYLSDPEELDRIILEKK